MGKLVYRMCLFVILIIAVAGGVYYYKTIYQKEEDMDNGTFVENTDRALQRAEKKVIEPALDGMQNKMAEAYVHMSGAMQQTGGKVKAAVRQQGAKLQGMVQDTLHDAEYAEHAAGSMLRQAGETGKEMVKQAVHAGKNMLSEAGDAGKAVLSEAGDAGKAVLSEAENAGKAVLSEAENARENMRNVSRKRA